MNGINSVSLDIKLIKWIQRLFCRKKFTLHEIQEVQDALTVEEILNISVNDKPYTMTMRTPGDEEALTRGILLSEQVYDHQEEHPVFSIVEKMIKT